jgi:hypothetical protein
MAMAPQLVPVEKATRQPIRNTMMGRRKETIGDDARATLPAAEIEGSHRRRDSRLLSADSVGRLARRAPG